MKRNGKHKSDKETIRSGMLDARMNWMQAELDVPGWMCLDWMCLDWIVPGLDVPGLDRAWIGSCLDWMCLDWMWVE
jgi:hypothetical protein